MLSASYGQYHAFIVASLDTIATGISSFNFSGVCDDCSNLLNRDPVIPVNFSHGRRNQNNRNMIAFPHNTDGAFSNTGARF
jgi:hypothetical protein